MKDLEELHTMKVRCQKAYEVWQIETDVTVLAARRLEILESLTALDQTPDIERLCTAATALRQYIKYLENIDADDRPGVGRLEESQEQLIKLYRELAQRRNMWLQMTDALERVYD